MEKPLTDAELHPEAERKQTFSVKGEMTAAAEGTAEAVVRKVAVQKELSG